ncbi:MAG: hypothetical protein NC911_10380 [Candidatus Omnitrophica bacterium]|nr:hypothetical protein [Candidatus Omnitrophota bacterium]
MAVLLLREDFMSDPRLKGWEPSAQERNFPDWVNTGGYSGKGCLRIPAGHWDSPLLAVTPFHYYLVRYNLKCLGKSYAAAIFFDKDGNELPSDHYTGADPAPNWEQQSFCFLAKAEAASAKIRFRVIQETMLVTEVEAQQVSPQEALAWVEAISQAIPPVLYDFTEEDLKPLGKFRKKLSQPGTVRLVLLGDSVMNDLSNSLFELLIQRHFSGLRIEVVSSTRSGGNCAYYLKEDRWRRSILQYQPDLLVVGGISHGNQIEPVRQLVEQVRQQSDTAVLLLTGAFITPERRSLPRYSRGLKKLAYQLNTGFLNTEEIWLDYIARSGHPVGWFMRDSHHANERGKQVLAHLLEIFLAAPFK